MKQKQDHTPYAISTIRFELHFKGRNYNTIKTPIKSNRASCSLTKNDSIRSYMSGFIPVAHIQGKKQMQNPYRHFRKVVPFKGKELENKGFPLRRAKSFQNNNIFVRPKREKNFNLGEQEFPQFSNSKIIKFMKTEKSSSMADFIARSSLDNYRSQGSSLVKTRASVVF